MGALGRRRACGARADGAREGCLGCGFGRAGVRDCRGFGRAGATALARDAPGGAAAGGAYARWARIGRGGAFAGLRGREIAGLEEQKDLLQAAEQTHQNGSDQGL